MVFSPKTSEFGFPPRRRAPNNSPEPSRLASVLIGARASSFAECLRTEDQDQSGKEIAGPGTGHQLVISPDWASHSFFLLRSGLESGLYLFHLRNYQRPDSRPNLPHKKDAQMYI